MRGVEAFPVDRKIDVNEATDLALKTLTDQGLVQKGDKLVFVVGIPMEKREPVNTIHISTV